MIALTAVDVVPPCAAIVSGVSPNVDSELVATPPQLIGAAADANAGATIAATIASSTTATHLPLPIPLPPSSPPQDPGRIDYPIRDIDRDLYERGGFRARSHGYGCAHELPR